MRSLLVKRGYSSAVLILSILTLFVSLGCSGGSSGNPQKDVATAYNYRNQNLYSETQAIEVQGNWIAAQIDGSQYAYGDRLRNFNPQTSRVAELYDANGDNVKETKINNFNSIANAANRLLDLDLAACVAQAGNNAKHEGYTTSSTVWADNYLLNSAAFTKHRQYPDRMPTTVSETNGENQFIQLILPFEIDPDCIFDTTIPQLDYLNPYYLTIVNNDWVDDVIERILLDFKNPVPDPVPSLPVESLDAYQVPCMVFVNGVNAQGEGPNGTNASAYTTLTQIQGINFDPGAGKSSIVFVAQPSVGLTTPPASPTPFALWAGGQSEIRIHLRRLISSQGLPINVDSKWFVLKGNDFVASPTAPAPEAPKVISIEPVDTVSYIDNDPSSATFGQTINPKDWDDLSNIGSGNRTTSLVPGGTNFLIRFSKPVIPETVGQSIVFGGAPFNGNISPLESFYTTNIPNPNPCAGTSHLYRDPIGTNVTVSTKLYLPDGTNTLLEGAIPFRVYPLHQNNLCAYVINPIIDIPGSPDLGDPPLVDPTADYTRIRVTVKLHLHDGNTLTAMTAASTVNQTYSPVNMGVAGFFGYYGSINSESFEKSFTVAAGGRYVNAPVSPHAMYYTMGPGGLGVVDLDGNGFTTNDPDFERVALVTTQGKYDPDKGNASMGIGNEYGYGAKATLPPDPSSQTQSYVGLGIDTPIPGVNEGSTGIDEVVRDSNGSAQLFPDPAGSEKYYNITDVEVGDFLDTIYFDEGNKWVNKSFHLSVINQVAVGSYTNNLISTPPTPNPPPLTVPVGMRPTHVLLDTFNITDEGAVVIMGKEVFTVDLQTLAAPVGLKTATRTGFIHLQPADLAGSSKDELFPPKPDSWVAVGVYPQQAGTVPVQFMNLGPVMESSTVGYGWYYGSRQQIGNFLFCADKANNKIRVLNSNSMEEITSISGLSAPDSLAVTADLAKLYVSNSGGQSVSVFNVNPRTEDFLNPLATIWVGSQPKGICCHPENEDVFVCNYGSSTISIINPKTNTVRKTLSSLLNKPWDMVVGPRQMNIGFGTQVFHGYISNYGGDNVLVYESGPSGYGGVGYDDILDPIPEKGENGQTFLPIQSPRGIVWDPIAGKQYPLTGGCFVGHSSGGHAVVSHIEFTSQQGTYGPIFLIPNSGAIGGTPGYGKRIFVITAQWGGSDNPLSGYAVSDVALLDYNRQSWENETWTGNINNVSNLGDLSGPQTFLQMNNKDPIRFLNSYTQTFNPDRLYISFVNSPVIDVVDFSTGQILKSITGIPGSIHALKTYFKN